VVTLTSSYVTVREHEHVDRTVDVGGGTLLDLDADGRVLGIEQIDGLVGWSSMARIVHWIGTDHA
jgi:hypothetical protein